ncbi:MAG: hypothetical protein V2I33_19570, partial [Kangiellaceae bacterium]|nr:hypothetical protein [Kangiellaceae bacterium]
YATFNWGGYVAVDQKTREANFIAFKQPNQSCYRRYRDLLQVMDVVVLNHTGSVHDTRLLACAIFYT